MLLLKERWHHDTTKDHLLNSRDIRVDVCTYSCRIRSQLQGPQDTAVFPASVLIWSCWPSSDLVRLNPSIISVTLRVGSSSQYSSFKSRHWMYSWRICVLSLSACCSVSLYWTGCENKSPSGTIKSKSKRLCLTKIIIRQSVQPRSQRSSALHTHNCSLS